MNDLKTLPDGVIAILREQNVSDLIGHIMFNRGNNSFVSITGNNSENGFVEFNGDHRVWIGFNHLRDSFFMTDVTGLSSRQAKRKIGNYPFKWNERQIKTAINKATE